MEYYSFGLPDSGNQKRQTNLKQCVRMGPGWDLGPHRDIFKSQIYEFSMKINEHLRCCGQGRVRRATNRITNHYVFTSLTNVLQQVQ